MQNHPAHLCAKISSMKQKLFVPSTVHVQRLIIIIIIIRCEAISRSVPPLRSFARTVYLRLIIVR